MFTRLLLGAFLAGGAFGTGAAVLLQSASLQAAPAPHGPSAARDGLAALKAMFRRPAAVPFPADNPFSEKKRALGEVLFHDRRLSIDNSRSCASCHDRAKGFADGKAQGEGVPGRPLKRHTPTLWNLAWSAPVFWDGRARSLEEQVAGPIESPDEMAQPMASVIARLSADDAMRRAFAEAFPQAPKVDAANLAKAIATFERTVVSGYAPFDAWVDGDESAISDSAKRGFALFNGKANCAACHTGWNFTDNKFHDIGTNGTDIGRGKIEPNNPKAQFAFKTPGLRDITQRAPFMHDGSLPDLEAVMARYITGGIERPSISPQFRKIELDANEIADVIEFLKTLTGTKQVVSLPVLPN